MSGGGGTEQAPGGLHLWPRHDSALSSDADRNVLTHPSILLVVLLNVSLNTLPVLALRVICQALKKPRPKVRRLGSPLCVPGSPSARACAGRRKTWGGDRGQSHRSQGPKGETTHSGVEAARSLQEASLVQENR